MNNNKLYNILLVITLSLFTLLNFFSCASTEPENITNPRNYTWKTDTIYNSNNYQTLMRSIWGSSENDIYMCGHSSGSPGGLWHYNGINWKTINLKDFVGSSGIYASVHGSSSDNVWVIGYRGSLTTEYRPYIVHYDGSNWTKHELNINMDPTNVYVVDKNDVWICGSNGIACHFDNVHQDWQIDTAFVELNEEDIYYLNSIIEQDNEIYSIGYKVWDNGLKREVYFFKRETNKWKLIDSYLLGDNKFGTALFSVENNLFSAGELGIYEWKDKNWDLKIPINKRISQLAHSSINNMILISSLGYVYHNNGSNTEQINSLSNNGIIYSGVWMNNKSATIIGWLTNESPQKTIVIKGE